MVNEGVSLKLLHIDTSYDTEDHFDEDPLFNVNQFYVPCLSNSIKYDRLAGFFSSSTFGVIANGLIDFILHGGTMRLIVSPHISPKDRDAVIAGELTESEVIEKSLIEKLFTVGNTLDEYSELLGWMVANKKLEIRIAVMYNLNGQLMGYDEIDSSSLFHYKIGIFEDPEGNKVSFSGSLNETFTAWTRNGESFNTFCNWKEGQSEYLEGHIKQFNQHWQLGKHNRSFVTTLPKAVENKWVKEIPKSIEDLEAYKTYLNKKSNNGLEKREYQQLAVENWVKQDYKGLFDMATGTGKTKTALMAATRLVQDKNNSVAIVIVCPYLHLAQMWEEEIQKFGFTNYVTGHSQSPNWKNDFERKVRLFGIDHETFIFVTTINTFCSSYVQKWINKIKTDILLIVDEVHRMGSPKYSQYLNDDFPYRLGLSATINRFRDPSGTDRLLQYFGNRCITYTLEKALKEHMLTPYKYHPIICYFSDSEYERIININKEIEALLEKDPKKNAKRIEELRINGSRIIAKMDNKLENLVKLMNSYKNEYHMLVYCGATSITTLDSDIDEETGNSEESEKLIMYVAKLLNEKYGLQLRTFTCADDISNRKIMIEDFKNKHIQSILAIRCLDEGVDIPEIKYAFLLSSSEDPKEYIQRRGRVLRKAKNKPYAEIFDFLAFPKSYASDTCSKINEKIEYGIVFKELIRVHEFSKLSLNPDESSTIIKKVSKIYNIENLERILNDSGN